MKTLIALLVLCSLPVFSQTKACKAATIPASAFMASEVTVTDTLIDRVIYFGLPSHRHVWDEKIICTIPNEKFSLIDDYAIFRECKVCCRQELIHTQTVSR